MKYLIRLFGIMFIMVCLIGNSYSQPPVKNLKQQGVQKRMPPANMNARPDSGNFKFFSEQVADFRILRYQIPGFDSLTLQQKKLCYYLGEAALCGRDIYYDQNYSNNIKVRKTIEALYNTRSINRQTEEWKQFAEYAKRFWFSNGIHHVYSNNKMIPEVPQQWIQEQLRACDPALLPLNSNESVSDFISKIIPILYDPSIAPKRVNLDPEVDMVKASSVNFYENVTQQEAKEFYSAMSKKYNKNPPSIGLNSKLVKDERGKITEQVWKVGGMYSPAIEKIIEWLSKAKDVAENEQQRKVIQLLIEYYQTGDLKKFDEYSIEWTRDTTSVVDFVNGFIEVYKDPLGYKASWEAYVSIKDFEASKRINTIGSQAQWFEDHSPIADEYKKKDVTGISAKVINVVVESGALAPLTAIGINLPNSDWIREQYGSKSVSLGNITFAYSEDGKTSGVIDEFYYNDEVKNRLRKYGSIADNLHTDMHEVIGHASGKIKPGVASPKETLQNYRNTLEEARADLVALYYVMDAKLEEIGVSPSSEVGKAEYDRYITNGLFYQLVRLSENENQVEEAHMRNRLLIASWVYEKGRAKNVISKINKEGKTYFVINDYQQLRLLFGELLREVQRIKSEGDYEAGRKLVENYGVKVDPVLHKEALTRFASLNIAPYKGFLQPHLQPVTDDAGNIINVRIQQPQKFETQMLNLGNKYGLLPVKN